MPQQTAPGWSRANPPGSCSTGCMMTTQGLSFYSGSPLVLQVSSHLSAYLDHPNLAQHPRGLCTSVPTEYVAVTGGRCVCTCGFKTKKVGTALVISFSRHLAPVCNMSFAQPNLTRGSPANDCNWYPIKISHIQKSSGSTTVIRPI